MKRITNPARCAYINIRTTDSRRFDLPMELELLLDGQPVRKLYRLLGGIASQRIELTAAAHSIALRLPDGRVLCRMVIPANEYSYLCNINEAADFALETCGPMRPTADCPHLDRLARLLTGKLVRMLDCKSPICVIYDDMKNRSIDYAWFEFWETALVVHFMPKSGHIPDLRRDFDIIEPYNRVKDIQQLSFPQALQLEAQIVTNLQNSTAAEGMNFYFNEDGFFCAKVK